MKTEQLTKILESGVEKGFLSWMTFSEPRQWDFFVELSCKSYKIEWWCNICYLTTECGTYIPFHDLEISGTWPNNFKTNLQFSYFSHKCAIIPIEDYPKTDAES